MNDILKLVISMGANLSGGLIKKQLNVKYRNGMFTYQFYNCLVSFVSAIVLLILSESLECSSYTVFSALLFGIITLLQQITNLYALECGPLSYTTVLISLSSLIPTVSGAVFWDEKIATVQYVGIALICICFVLSVKADKTEKRANTRWLIFCLIAFLCTGLIGIMQKIHQSSVHKNELDAFLIISFVVSFVFSFVHSIILYRTTERNKTVKSESVINPLPIFLMILSGIFVAINNKFNLYLSGVMDSAVFFPTVNGGGLTLTSIAAFVIFKEKLSTKQWAGIIIGIISVILISNPFS